MDSRSLIDAQFDRAVEIVQGLPKNGPIQTGYEDKLTMYSLYKQATVGNVKAPRPGLFDMLGRAKWDAWAQHKDLDSHEAKWLYVDALLKVLHKYSDKTVAKDLVQELESYGGDASNLVMSSSITRPYSASSGSTISDNHPSQHFQPPLPAPITAEHQEADAQSSSSEDTEDEPTDLRPQPPRSELSRSQSGRPQSSLSGRAYRTPLAGSYAIASPPPRIPSAQPLPGFETPSAFANQPAAASPVYYRPASSSFGPYTGSLPATSPQEVPYPLHPMSHPSYNQIPRAGLERALESVQAHVAALTERIEVLETRSSRNSSSLSSRQPSTPERHLRDRGLLKGRKWTVDDWGMWSFVLNPVSRCLDVIQQLTRFFTSSENRSPALTIIRRLALDVSFLACVLVVVKMVWRRSGLRRREVVVALAALWRAIVGAQPQRIMADKNV